MDTHWFGPQTYYGGEGMSVEKVGIYRKGKFKATVMRKPTKVYSAWGNMLKRCYNPSLQRIQPTYIGCTVCDEWLEFQTFAQWYYDNYPSKDINDPYYIDKDLILPNNKIYSPDTCILVSRRVNNFMTDHSAMRGKYMIGVSLHKDRNRFQSNCSNPFTGKREYLGLFNTELEAHLRWLERKVEIGLMIVEHEGGVTGKYLIERCRILSDHKLYPIEGVA